jgi:hypothetical protein
MKSIQKLISLWIVAFCLIGCSFFQPQPKGIQPEEFDELIPVEQLYADIDYFMEVLAEVHVNPYMNISAVEFEQHIQQLKAEITTPLTRVDFFLKFCPVIHTLKDSHTTLMPVMEEFQYHWNDAQFLPFAVSVADNGDLLLLKDFSDHDIPPFTKITTINQSDADTLVEDFSHYIPGPVAASQKKRIDDLFEEAFWLVYSTENSFQIATEAGTYTLPAITLADVEAQKGMLFQESAPVFEAGVAYTRLSSTVGLLTITDFSAFNDHFRQQITDIFTLIQNEAISDLIIDVRGNDGGDSANGDILLEFLTDVPYRAASEYQYKLSQRWLDVYKKENGLSNRGLKKLLAEIGHPDAEIGDVIAWEPEEILPADNALRFSGDVFVLQDHNSFSATVDFLVIIKDYQLAVIIGTETGEGPTSFGNHYKFALPNSRLSARVSVAYQIRPSGDLDMTHGIMPDHYVVQTKEDALNQIDTMLAYTLDLISKNEK